MTIERRRWRGWWLFGGVGVDGETSQGHDDPVGGLRGIHNAEITWRAEAARIDELVRDRAPGPRQSK